MDDSHAKVEIKPQLKPRGSVAKEEDTKLPTHDQLGRTFTYGARVQPRWIQGIRRWGRCRRLWKNTYLITDSRERLETDSVVGDSVVEKSRLNPDGNSARETGARKK